MDIYTSFGVLILRKQQSKADRIPPSEYVNFI
jgi:hypothetical protein